MSTAVHLGFATPSGDPVQIPVAHMVVTGQTQQSGKTTTLEALIQRSDLPAIAFLTKRGEGSLSGRQVLPFFRERADWQFVQSILESTMHERMKFERAWIVRACQGARTLADVQRNVRSLQESSRSSLSKDVYMLLGEYLQRVLPAIASLPKMSNGGAYFTVSASPFSLEDRDPNDNRGLAVMDLIRYPEELQMLVIASTLEWIHKNAHGVITVIPEAWKFIPEGKNTPVKLVAEKLAREGAALKNFIWIDSQDIAGVAKLLLRSCSVWLIGVQREANEIKRALSNMPEGMKKPKAGDVATLELGQFFCCHGHELRKVYVQPVWMSPAHAEKVALGKMKAYELARVRPAAGGEEEDPMLKDQVQQLTEQNRQLADDNEDLRRQLAAALSIKTGVSSQTIASGSAGKVPPIASPMVPLEQTPTNLDVIVALAVEQIRRDPVLIRLATTKPAIELTIQKKVLPLDTSTVKGKVAKLIAEGFFVKGTSRPFGDIRAELIRRGVDKKTGNVVIGNPLKELVQDGFLFRDGDNYELAPDAEVQEVCA